ncbi:KAD4 kinase, partial [Zosterops hypoxanthus]|nr:KAD4 kinase [Zosterops hypoxanthus]
MASKLLRAVVLGPPGSGKGTVCDRIARSFGLQHLSSGQFLRENIGGGGGDWPSQGGQDHFPAVSLMPSTQTSTLSPLFWLHPLCSQTSHCDFSAPSRGFPRTLGQAKALDGICELDLVISLNIPFETLKDRLSARWVHPASGRVYNMDFNPPHVQGVDDLTGEPLVQRQEDRPEAVAARLRKYKDAAKPVIELYK